MSARAITDPSESRISRAGSRENASMNITIDEPPGRPRKTTLQLIEEQFNRQMRPLRQMQEMQEMVKRYSPEYQLKDLARQFEPHRQIQEMLERSTVPSHIQAVIDGSAIAAQAKRIVEETFPRQPLASLGLYQDAIRRAADSSIKNAVMWRPNGADFIGSIAKQYEKHLKLITEGQDTLVKLRRLTTGGFSAIDFGRQLEEANPGFQAMEEAKKSLDRLWPTFRDIDFSQFEANKQDEQETKAAAKSIAQAAALQESLQDAIERIVLAIQAQEKPTVQLMLWLYFRTVLGWLIAGATTKLKPEASRPSRLTAALVADDRPNWDSAVMLVKVRLKYSAPSTNESFTTGTWKVLSVSPGAKVSVSATFV